MIYVLLYSRPEDLLPRTQWPVHTELKLWHCEAWYGMTWQPSQQVWTSDRAPSLAYVLACRHKEQEGSGLTRKAILGTQKELHGEVRQVGLCVKMGGTKGLERAALRPGTIVTGFKRSPAMLSMCPSPPGYHHLILHP